VILDPVSPILQLYVLAPLAVKVDGNPAHIVIGEADAVTVGIELTVTVTVAVFVQPAALVPVTRA